MRSYGILSAVALTFFLCPSCDDRSGKEKFDRVDDRAVNQRIGHDYDAAPKPYVPATPTGPTVSERPFTEGEVVPPRASEPSATEPVKAKFHEAGEATGRAVDRAGEGLEKAAGKTEEGLQKAADKTDEGLQKAGGAIERKADEVGDRQTDTRQRMEDTSGPFAKTLPEFTLQDPNGTSYNKQTVSGGGGLILVVSAPTLMSGGDQNGWARALAEARGDSRGKIAFVEDMSQATFKDTARNEMKKEYDPTTGPVVLVDESGSFRSGLQVAEDQTVVLVYDADGRLIHSEQGKPSPALAKTIWRKLEKK